MIDRIRSFRPAVLTALATAVAVAIVGIISLLIVSPPMIKMLFSDPVSLASEQMLAEILLELTGVRCPAEPGWRFIACRFDWLGGIGAQLMASPMMVVRLQFIIAAIGAASVLAFLDTYMETPYRETIKVLRGRRIAFDAYATRALRNTIGRDQSLRDGLWLLPGVQLDRPSETRNILMVGTQGSGKTGLLRAYVEQLIERRDRLFVLDTKGDMAAGLPTDEFIFVAPHDARSWALDIGRELANSMLAREFAAKCIPVSEHEPMWTQAARAILADLTMALRVRLGEAWGWEDLRDLALSSPSEIRQSLLNINVRSAVLVTFGENPDENRTVLSILITLWVAVLTIIEPLASVWAGVPTDRRFTIADWVKRGSRLPRTLVFQKSADYPELSNLVGSFLAERVAAAALAPHRRGPNTERLAMILDEFPEVSIDRLPRLLALGREMNVTTIATVQDLGQISLLLGRENASIVEARFGIRIVLKLEPGDAVERICSVWAGTRRIRRRRDATADELAKGITKPTETVVEPVIASDFLTDDLGVFETSNGRVIRMMVTGFSTLAVLDVPLTIWPDRRPAHMPAAWTLTEQ